MCSADKIFHREKFSLEIIFVGENYRREKVTKFQEKFVNFPRKGTYVSFSTQIPRET